MNFHDPLRSLMLGGVPLRTWSSTNWRIAEDRLLCRRFLSISATIADTASTGGCVRVTRFFVGGASALAASAAGSILIGCSGAT